MATYVSDSGPLDDYFRGTCPILEMIKYQASRNRQSDHVALNIAFDWRLMAVGR